MLKCNRCNRDRLPTAEYEVKTLHAPTQTRNTTPLRSRLCNACAALTVATHGASNVTKIRGSGDEGIPAEVAAAIAEVEPAEDGSPSESES